MRAVGAVGEPEKHCFSWQGRWRGGASASGGSGEGGVGGGGEGGGGWAWTGARKTLLFMAGRCGGGR